MVRKYKRKTIRKAYERDILIDAVKVVLEDKKSIKSTAKSFNVPRSTLLRWCRRASKDGISNLSSITRFNTVFSESQENDFVDHLKFAKERLFTLNITAIRQLAYQYAEQLKAPHKFNHETGLAGHDWYINFSKRHEEFKLNPRDKSSGTKRECMDKFFDALSALQTTHNFSQTRIYNVSENSVIPLPKVTPQNAGSNSSNSALQYDIITTITCCNAAGHFIPPLMVYPAPEFDKEFLEGCPPDTEIVCHPTGWVQSEIFYPTWFEHFLEHVNPTRKRPILLLISGCQKHIMNIEFMDRAKKHHTHILCIPSGENFKLDPLECNFMSTLKDNYVEECKKWIEANPGKLINLKNIGRLYGKAYLTSATPLNAMQSFEHCGIHPFNRYVFSNEENVPEITPSITEVREEVPAITITPILKPVSMVRMTEADRVHPPKKRRKKIVDNAGTQTTEQDIEPQSTQITQQVSQQQVSQQQVNQQQVSSVPSAQPSVQHQYQPYAPQVQTAMYCPQQPSVSYMQPTYNIQPLHQNYVGYERHPMHQQ